MTPSPRFAALGAAAVLVMLAACGGGDDAAADTTPGTTPGTVVPASDPPVASDPSASTSVVADDPTQPTIDPDVPEEFLPGIGPVGVIGESLPPLPQSGDDPAIGMTVPVLIGETFDGVPVRIDPATDGPTWVVFLAHWCPHCNDEIPRINELRDAGRLPADLDIVGVSTAVAPDRPNFPPGEWLIDKDWTFLAMADGIDMELETFIAAAAWGVNGFPFSVLVDGDGTVVARWSGERTTDELMSLLTSNLALT